MNFIPIDRSHLLSDLRRHVVEVTFVKADNTRRTMRATLIPAFLPEQYGGILEQNAPDSITVWDLGENDFRSIPLTRVVSMQDVITA